MRRSGPTLRQVRCGSGSVALILLVLLVPAPAAIGAGHKPSAGELWRDYPLAPAAAPSPAPTARHPAAARPAAARPAAPAAPGRSDGSLLWLPFAIAAVAVAAYGLLVALRRRPRPPAARSPTGREPPDPARSWEAAIEWRRTEDGARFCVVARSGGATVVLAESQAVPWPPSSESAVRELASIPDDLAAAFVAAGWIPLSAGDAWYDQRLAWRPRGVRRGSRRGRAHLTAVSSSSIGRRSSRTHGDPKGEW